MSLKALTSLYAPAVEEELKRAVSLSIGSAGTSGDLSDFRQMMAYHMGWEGEGAGPEAQGKRIRPLLVLLTAAASGGDWRSALPGAASVELVHNFSLIHDDIEDNSPLRRGRPTVWKKWGIPQAVNTGDGMFTLAHLALLRLAETVSAEAALAAARVLQMTCLNLTQGQYLDIHYEACGDLSLEAYWPMVEGKTAALLAACTEIGALAAGASPERREAFRSFGKSLGLAFQVQDDLLGVWGDAELTGKSAESDLVSGKKSLPVLFGLSQAGPFAQRWAQGEIRLDEVASLAAQLKAEGSLDYTQETAARLTRQALQALDEAQPEGEAGLALRELADKLLKRQA